MKTRAIKSDKDLSQDQDDIFAEYRRSGAIKNRAEEIALHLFWSPSIVPKGLTHEEVRICLLLSPLRSAQRRMAITLRGELPEALLSKYLPNILLKTKITREQFQQGIKLFIVQSAKAMEYRSVTMLK